MHLLTRKDVLVQRDEIAESIKRLGYKPVKVAMTLDLEAAKNLLTAAKPFKVVNLVESIDGSDRLMRIAPALLDSLSIDYTGSECGRDCHDRKQILAKRLMKQP